MKVPIPGCDSAPHRPHHLTGRSLWFWIIFVVRYYKLPTDKTMFIHRHRTAIRTSSFPGFCLRRHIFSLVLLPLICNFYAHRAPYGAQYGTGGSSYDCARCDESSFMYLYGSFHPLYTVIQPSFGCSYGVSWPGKRPVATECHR